MDGNPCLSYSIIVTQIFSTISGIKKFRRPSVNDSRIPESFVARRKKWFRRGRFCSSNNLVITYICESLLWGLIKQAKPTAWRLIRICTVPLRDFFYLQRGRSPGPASSDPFTEQLTRSVQQAVLPPVHVDPSDLRTHPAMAVLVSEGVLDTTLMKGGVLAPNEHVRRRPE